MQRRDFIQGSVLRWLSARSGLAGSLLFDEPKNQLATVRSSDGTTIACESAGAGPSLVLVHGGVGDHTRWLPLFHLLTPHFNVTAMDRRGHGTSGAAASESAIANTPSYSLEKEAEDITAIVNSRPDKVFLLGHSYGAICSLEAAFLTQKIAKLVLYEPPIQVEQKFLDPAVVSKMEELIRTSQREQALILFMRDIVRVPPQEIAAAKARPTWASRVADISASIREIRAIDAYQFDAARIAKLALPVLLLQGGETAPHHKRAVAALARTLPNHRLFVFEGQGHNAMDTVPQQFVQVVSDFLLETK